MQSLGHAVVDAVLSETKRGFDETKRGLAVVGRLKCCVEASPYAASLDVAFPKAVA